VGIDIDHGAMMGIIFEFDSIWRVDAFVGGCSTTGTTITTVTTDCGSQFRFYGLYIKVQADKEK